MTNILSYAAMAAKNPLERFSYEPETLGAHDVEVKISHCGICYSDVHLIDNDWGSSVYPFVPGHEIVGTISIVGRQVKHLTVGNRVGIGWQRSACLECKLCMSGHENLCASQQAVCVGHHGGFSERIRLDSRFVFLLPEGLSSSAAAPLLCGGATVFAPLKRYGVTANSVVGVIGIGGLGHMALLFLQALGCEVTAFSSSESKREEALKMGAHHFISSLLPKDIATQAGKFDLLVSTVHARLDWLHFIATLKPNGVLCLVGAPPGFIQIPAGLLISAQRSVCGSDIASRADIVDMLAFSERYHISPLIENAPMSAVNQGIARLRSNQARYRIVLESDFSELGQNTI